MPVYMIGEGRQGIPFDRRFFRDALGELVEASGHGDSHRLNLFLTDGVTLEVCEIKELTDSYVVVQAYLIEDDVSDASVHVVPYGIIYRLQVKTKPSGDERVGFNWTPARKGRAARK